MKARRTLPRIPLRQRRRFRHPEQLEPTPNVPIRHAVVLLELEVWHEESVEHYRLNGKAEGDVQGGKGKRGEGGKRTVSTANTAVHPPHRPKRLTLTMPLLSSPHNQQIPTMNPMHPHPLVARPRLHQQLRPLSTPDGLVVFLVDDELEGAGKAGLDLPGYRGGGKRFRSLSQRALSAGSRLIEEDVRRGVREGRRACGM